MIEGDPRQSNEASATNAVEDQLSTSNLQNKNIYDGFNILITSVFRQKVAPVSSTKTVESYNHGSLLI